MQFLWDSLRLPYGAEEISQITHGFSTGMMNVVRVYMYAADAASFTGLNLPNCLVSFTDDGGSIGIDESTVASGAAWISEGGGSTRGRLSMELKYSRRLVTIDAPFDRRFFPSAESSGEDILEYLGEIYPAKTIGMELPYGENFIILGLTSTVFV